MKTKQSFVGQRQRKHVLKEYNDTIHSVTGFTPNYLKNTIEPEIIPTELRRTEILNQIERVLWKILAKIVTEIDNDTTRVEQT